APGSLDAVAANNRATQATVVRAPVTNLEVTNLDSADPLLVGHPLTYTVTVANHGPDDAPGVTLTDQLPPGAYGNLTATQGSCTRAGAAVTCLLGGMANGTSATLTFPLTPTQAGTATNAASALPTGGAIDPVPANNRASQPTAVRMPSTDLAVTNEDSADPLLAGQTLAYSVVVANHGPDDAPGVTLTDTVPAGMDYGAILTTQGTCTRAATVVTCRLGPLASGGVASIVLPMVPTRAQSALNAASVAPAGALDPVSANNRASATTTVRAPSTDLAVAVADSADPALTGQPLDYRVTVTNNGPDDAPGVTLTDTLPAGMAYGVPLPSQGACTRVGATVTCQLGPLASGASAALALPMVPTAAGIASDRASAVATGGVDPVSANNAVTQSTAIHASSSDLAVTNDAAPGATGGSLVYTVTVTNNGPDDAPAATLTDTLPSGTAYGTPAASQGSCVRSGTTVLCQLGPLANGATATVTLTVTPNGTSATSTASAAVAGGGIDPNGANNRLSRTTAVH
ncbi:MAG: hypothetical protein QOI63_2073, partial [Thermoplasmata archaeon]|nr:hypothetical protein [Thermoplasmata archaeon]